jgi:phytoene desaturase
VNGVSMRRTDELPVVIIGAGIGGLSAAIHLAAQGIPVTILEKNPQVGGKMGRFQAEGFHWDTGPTVITMRHVFDNLFQTAGRKLSDYIEFTRPDPLTRYFFPDGLVFDATSDLTRMLAQIERLNPHDVEGYLGYLSYAARIHRITGPVFIYDTPPSLASLRRVPVYEYLQIDPFRKMNTAIERFVRDSHLRQLLARFGTYVGANPFQAPATLNVIAHMELSGGVWYPKGGIYTIAQGMLKLASELGVVIKTDRQIDQILLKNERIHGISDGAGDVITTNKIISNVDIGHLYSRLIPPAAVPTNTRRHLVDTELSCSGFIILAGVNKTHPELAHHNIFFSSNYRSEFETIFVDRRPPDEPTIYVSISSKTDPDHAPPGSENWFILVNVPPDTPQYNWEDHNKMYTSLIFERLASMGFDIRDALTTMKTITPPELAKMTNAQRGALYGRSSNQPLSAFLRPHNRDPYIPGLYHAGGTVHPGGGVPMVTLSGKAAAKYVLEDLAREKVLPVSE